MEKTYIKMTVDEIKMLVRAADTVLDTQYAMMVPLRECEVIVLPEQSNGHLPSPRPRICTEPDPISEEDKPEDHGCRQVVDDIEYMYSIGINTKQIAQLMGVAQSTVSRWRKSGQANCVLRKKLHGFAKLNKNALLDEIGRVANEPVRR